jgi:hypothetical protein
VDVNYNSYIVHSVNRGSEEEEEREKKKATWCGRGLVVEDDMRWWLRLWQRWWPVLAACNGR